MRTVIKAKRLTRGAKVKLVRGSASDIKKSLGVTRADERRADSALKKARRQI